jgi:hypothetical protein
MGAGNASTGGGGGGSPNQMAKDKAKAKAEKDRIENAKTKDKFGYTKPKSKFKTFVEGGGVIGAVTKPFRDASEKVNRKFYNEKVVPAGKSKAPDYETYMKDRLAGKTDAYGNPTPNEGGNNNNNNSILTKSDQPNNSEPVTAPSGEDATNPVETTETEKKYDPRKTKKKGRKKNILTSAKGVTKTSSDYSLGKPSLLGMV